MFSVTVRPAKKVVIEPVPYKFKKIRKRVATFDSETDKFALDPKTGRARVVRPFTCCFFDGEEYADFWGDDCIEQFFAWLETRDEEYMIFVHNGGFFDFYVPQPNGVRMLDWLDANSSPFIMNKRIVRCYLQGQEFRDSYSLVPEALAAFEKVKIDYDLFERDVREKHKTMIMDYQQSDCLNLYNLIQGILGQTGDKLTIASHGLAALRSFHGFETMDETTDLALRDFYFGGRCEAFEVGELKPAPGKTFKLYDVNNMYGWAMAHVEHPVSCTPQYRKVINDQTDFAKIDATSWGALPVRTKGGGLSFPHGRQTFFATGHEIRAGLELGLIKIHKVHYAIHFLAKSSFGEFVYDCKDNRDKAKAAGDKILDLYYKRKNNAPYGKFAQDPRKYETFLFDPETWPKPQRCTAGCVDELQKPPFERKPPCERCLSGETSFDGWAVDTINQGKLIWSRPQTRARHNSFFNVATAASITGAARAKLLRGIAAADRPLYCDTDSLMCEGLDAELDEKKLGAWKTEATGDVAYIAGKKLYAVFWKDEEVKKASKGVKLSASEIARVAQGEVIEYAHEVPKFGLDGTVNTTQRRIRRTANLAA